MCLSAFQRVFLIIYLKLISTSYIYEKTSKKTHWDATKCLRIIQTFIIFTRFVMYFLSQNSASSVLTLSQNGPEVGVTAYQDQRDWLKASVAHPKLNTTAR